MESNFNLIKNIDYKINILIQDVNQILILIQDENTNNIYFESYDDDDFSDLFNDVNDISGIYKILIESIQNNQIKIDINNNVLTLKLIQYNTQLKLTEKSVDNFDNILKKKFQFYQNYFENIKKENEDLKEKNKLYENIKKENEDLKEKNKLRK